MTHVTRRPRTVYFIRPIGMKGPVKIGCSVSPDGRRTTLEKWSPFPLEIVAQFDGCMDDERRVHSLFWEQHQRGEWFEWSPELQALIGSINAGAFNIDALPATKILPKPRKCKPWSQEQRLRASYVHRLNHIRLKKGFHLPDRLDGWERRLNDPAIRKALDEFVSDPAKHGITHEQFRADLRRAEIESKTRALLKAAA
jgi:hypothetical protein